jgi:hypothetical protein
MRISRMQKTALALAAPLFFLLCALFLGTAGMPAAHAQSMLAGDIAGTVTDPSGAAVVGAKVTATNRETGAVASVNSSGTGAYRFSLLKPGPYSLNASASGFSATSTIVTVAIGQITTQNLALTVGAASETVEVSATAQLLQTDSAQLSTSVSLEQLQNIPNPGSDITYAAQAKPGVVMNTGANSSSGTLGYGNFSAFGLPGTSNNFTVNGMEVNDPFLNLNNSGPSNLLLGLDDMQETNVITNAYEVEYGTLGGVQLNMISRSGSDKFHGNADWSWNGDSMNANDWYNKSPVYNATPVARPFSNYNQWAGGIGGPIWKNKAFFFFDDEGIDFITSSQSVVYMPDPAFESSVVGADTHCDDSTSSLYETTAGVYPAPSPGNIPNPAAASECAFYNYVFSLYNGAPNHADAVESLADPGALQLSVPSKFALTEKLITARVDVNLSSNDKMFGHFKRDFGLQPSYTDPINSAFDAQSSQPDYEGQFAETHTFGTKAVNQFLMTGSWYSAVFVNKNPTTELATFPFQLSWFDSFANDLNHDGIYWPEGRNVTQYQIGDDFSYTAGKQTFKVGFSYKKDDVSDFDTGVLSVPIVLTDASYDDFQTGQSLLGQQNFTTNSGLPLSLYTLGMYFGDDIKLKSNFTLTPGIRIERNSNVSCRKNCLSNFGGDFFTLAASAPLNTTSGAYNAQIKSGLPTAFTSYQAFMVEPRIGFTYALGTKTVLRGGFGYFTDVFPGTIADTMLDNPPLTLSFLIYGTTFGGPTTMPLEPSNPDSYQSLAAGANTTFQSTFKTGGSYDSMSHANGNFSAPSFTSVQGRLHYPTYLEYNLQIEHEFSKFDSVQIGYVGNRGYHEPDENVGANAYGGYGLPASAAPAPSFGPVTEVDSNANSNYNGLIVSFLHQGQGLNVQLNYAWSHALDEISNGGIEPFDSGSIEVQVNPHNLHQNYGNADYDVRQYLSANYLYTLPYSSGPRLLTADWQIGGTVFYSTGSPFTPTTYVSDFGISNYGNGQNVTPMKPGISAPHHCQGFVSATTGCFTTASLPATAPVGTSIANPEFPDYPYVNTAPGTATNPDWVITPTAGAFGSYDRNQFWGPSYADADVTIQKGFKIPHMGDSGKFVAGMTVFNVFNHPNFGLPTSLLDSSHFGTTLYVEGPPTSIYGSGVGGDPSVRIAEFTSKFEF